MGMWTPYGGAGKIVDFLPTTTSAQTVTVTAHSAAHTNGAWTELLASTTANAFGILLRLANLNQSGVDTSCLVDIGIGGAGAETVLIPKLNAGYSSLDWAGGTAEASSYYFPIFVAGGSRLSARAQAVIGSDTVSITYATFGAYRYEPTFVGRRVTAYGIGGDPDSDSKGVTVTAAGSNNTYGSSAAISASTTYPIKYMQVGFSGAGALFASSMRFQAKLLIGSTIVVEPLYGTMSGGEIVTFSRANEFLSRMSFNLPAGSALDAQIMCQTASAAFDMIVYGVD